MNRFAKSIVLFVNLFSFSYDADGNLLGTMEQKPPMPTRIQFEFSSELVKTIDEAYSDGVKLVNVSMLQSS